VNVLPNESKKEAARRVVKKLQKKDNNMLPGQLLQKIMGIGGVGAASTT
jgi:hypothetical protein